MEEDPRLHAGQGQIICVEVHRHQRVVLLCTKHMIPQKSAWHMSDRASLTSNSSETAEPCSSPSRRPGSVPEQAVPPRESNAHNPHVTKQTIVIQNGLYPSHESSASLDSQCIQINGFTCIQHPATRK
eukprot:7652936-Ditylum_brightwellii.AAC.1